MFTVNCYASYQASKRVHSSFTHTHFIVFRCLTACCCFSFWVNGLYGCWLDILFCLHLVLHFVTVWVTLIIYCCLYSILDIEISAYDTTDKGGEEERED